MTATVSTSARLRTWDPSLAAAAESLGEQPTPVQLRALAAELAAAALHTLPARPAPSGNRITLAAGAGQPHLGIADFPAGRPTPVHDHGTWGVGLVLDGTDLWERFAPDGRLLEARELTVGDTFVIGPPPEDVHRQTARDGDVRELLLLRSDPHQFPRTHVAPLDSPVERAVAALLDGDHAALTGLYVPGALADVNVPHWWFQTTEQATINELLLVELESPGRRCVALRRTDTTDGVLIETAVRLQNPDGGRYWRDQHHLVFHEGRIVEHIVYCTGIWDAATVAQHSAEVELVRP
jgi:hypothetical protein